MTTVRTTLEEVITSLRQGQGLTGFSHLTQFLQLFQQATSAGQLKANPEQFNPIFQEILAAQAKGESTVVADILEFQLSPLLN